MEDMYGFHSIPDYAVSPENLILPAEYHSLVLSSGDHYRPFPVYGSEDLISSTSVITEAIVPGIIPRKNRRDQVDDNVHHDANNYSVIKAKIASHPSYPKLIDAYIDCQKVGAPPEIACLLDEIRRENDVCKRNVVSVGFGADPELDEFMETYCDILVKYKSDLSRPFDEATTFLNKIETQLSNLCKGAFINTVSDEGVVSSEDEFSEGEAEAQETQMAEAQETLTTSEDQELKDTLLRKFGGHISSLKQEFSKKKKKGKLPSEARQTLLEWWHLHYKWPYPTEADKISLAESTGLDQKQINNWFINQRKRHWKPSENMQLAVMGSLSGQYFYGD